MKDSQEFVIPQPAVASLPVVRRSGRFPVQRIYCVGKNYVTHVREMGGQEDREPPAFFQKPADSLVEDGATIPYPPRTEDFHDASWSLSSRSAPAAPTSRRKTRCSTSTAMQSVST